MGIGGSMMAQASSAQREPSMEEILASIRRIIEDSEGGRREGGQPASDPVADAAAGEVESFRAEFKPNPLPPATAEAGDGGRNPHDLEREEKGSPEGMTRAALAVSIENAGEDDNAGEEDEEDAAVIPVAANASSVVPPRAEVADEEPASPQHPVPADAGNRAILSEAPGRKVAAAFEELNEALLAHRRKSLDQMAEDMLRPMLQEWLDDNLPQLVERLVREEIERVARGI